MPSQWGKQRSCEQIQQGCEIGNSGNSEQGDLETLARVDRTSGPPDSLLAVILLLFAARGPP